MLVPEAHKAAVLDAVAATVGGLTIATPGPTTTLGRWCRRVARADRRLVARGVGAAAGS